MKHKLEYLFVIALIRISKILPESFVFGLLKKISAILFYILSSRRKLAILNLRFAYPDLNNKEIYNIAKKNYESLAITLSEILLIYNNRKKLEDFIENPQEAIKTINELSKNNTKPILFTTAHFGNWEILAHYFGSIGFKLVVVGREGNNPLIEKNITIPFRQKFGNELAHKEEAMMKMVRFLKAGQNIGILIDQKGGNTNSVVTTFFGRECKTSKTIGSLKLKFDPIIIPIFSLRQLNGKYKFIIKKFDYNPIGNKEIDILNITQKVNDIFEEIVRLEPAQWFWMHNRWKID